MPIDFVNINLHSSDLQVVNHYYFPYSVKTKGRFSIQGRKINSVGYLCLEKKVIYETFSTHIFLKKQGWDKVSANNRKHFTNWRWRPHFCFTKVINRERERSLGIVCL